MIGSFRVVRGKDILHLHLHLCHLVSASSFGLFQDRLRENARKGGSEACRLPPVLYDDGLQTDVLPRTGRGKDRASAAGAEEGCGAFGNRSDGGVAEAGRDHQRRLAHGRHRTEASKRKNAEEAEQ